MPDPATQGSLYIGLISGTSMDGIDAALVNLGVNSCEVVDTHAHPYPERLGTALRAAIWEPGLCTIDQLGCLDQWVGECFRDATLALLANSGADQSSITAIGSHGQTLRHQPHAERPFTLQIGDPNIIAAGTGIATVADFRRRDIALGGEGAPLTPAFHSWLFSDDHIGRVILNIGGIANITVLNPGEDVRGFDTGPGNTLLDAWINEQQGCAFDEGGAWAAGGECQESLLNEWLADPYFSAPPPKSTGFEYFNLAWMRSTGDAIDAIAARDIQATLARLTTRSVADAIEQNAAAASEVLVCGGGTRNDLLMKQLTDLLPGRKVRPTDEFGLDADWVEAVAFAWLARQFLDGAAGNMPSVTGAARPAVLGSLFRGTA